jgi:NADPH oxidase
MGFMDQLKKQLWGSKLLFNIIFHGGHMGLFAFGWYVQNSDIGCQKSMNADDL